jgi:uncharacterized protein (TIGR03437 family)
MKLRELQVAKWSFVVVCLLPCVAFGAPAQSSLRYLDIGANNQAQSRSLAVDTSGNIFVVSTVVGPSGRPSMRVTKTDPQGTELTHFDFGGSGTDTPNGAVVDQAGNLVVVGSTSSFDFPSIPSVGTTTPIQTAFVVKLNPQLSQILFSIRIGGVKSGGGVQSAFTTASSAATDGAGNIYFTGTTTSNDFPITTGAFQTQPPAGDGFGTPSFAFITQILPSGKIGYSTYYGGRTATCNGGSSCIGVFGQTAANAIAVDNTGAVVIAGNTDSDALPVKSVAGPNCLCNNLVHVGFVAKIGSAGSQLMMSRYIPNSEIGLPGYSDVSIAALGLDPKGDIVLGGTAPSGFAITPGVVGPIYPGGYPPPTDSPYAGFVSKIDQSSGQYIFSTYLGGNVQPPSSAGGINGVTSLKVDSQGNILLTGGAIPSALPANPAPALLGQTFVGSLSANATRFTNVSTAPAGAAGQDIALTSSNLVAVLGRSGSLWIYPAGTLPGLVAVANAAGIAASSKVAALELVSLYGNGIGVNPPVNGQVVNGAFTSSLGGIQVLFDGIPAPLLYVGPNQINLVVPQTVPQSSSGSSQTTIRISGPNGTVSGPALFVNPSQPEVFANTQTGTALATNQDGTPNSASNPARQGTVIALWATGTGLTPAPRPDGAIASPPWQMVKTPVVVLDGAVTSQEVVYAGEAPGLVQGMAQINFRLTSALPPATLASPFRLQAGTALSSQFLIYVAP